MVIKIKYTDLLKINNFIIDTLKLVVLSKNRKILNIDKKKLISCRVLKFSNYFIETYENFFVVKVK